MKEENLTEDYVLVKPEVIPINGGGIFQFFVSHPRAPGSRKAEPVHYRAFNET